MKNTLILLCLLSAQISCVSQVHFSEVLEDYIIFGPNNISEIDSKVASFYLNDIREAEAQLRSYLKEDEATMATINQGKVRKKEKIEILELQKAIDNINLELDIYLDFISLWERTFEQNIQAESLVKYQEEHPGKCAEILTTHGKLDLNILTIDISPMMNNPVEILRMKKGKAGSKWVKKKANRNCLSADPNDCLVWCLVESSGGYEIIDTNKSGKQYKSCPDGFDLDENTLTCQRLNPLIGTRDSKVYKFSTTEFPSMAIQSWEISDCN